MADKRKVTAKEIYNLLINEFKIKERIGSVEIILGGISAKYNGKDALGDLLQEWFSKWMDKNNFYYRTRKNTQEFPDFLLQEADNGGLLEIKTFNSDASPAFDIANFDSYCKSLLKKPERLDADYIVMSYKMVDANLSIEDVWLKKVWEIAGTSTTNGINIQAKNKKIDNLRPVEWFNTSTRVKNKPFSSKLDFITAISKIHNTYTQCDTYKDNWLENVKSKYFENTGVKL